MDISGPRLDDLSDGNIWPWPARSSENEQAERQAAREEGIREGIERAAAFVESHTLQKVIDAWSGPREDWMFGHSPEHDSLAAAIRQLSP